MVIIPDVDYKKSSKEFRSNSRSSVIIWKNIKEVSTTFEVKLNQNSVSNVKYVFLDFE